ncbi:MAG TPA: PRC-barrel domain-containing protein [Blastocatellia bacterium]|nr:PRC-barrel domain-containing protein [Blastocatellia bacterium]
MTATKDYAGKLLISVTDGKNLGEVKDVYCNNDATRVIAAHLGKSGIINRKSLLVELSHVTLFGADAWLVDGSEVVIATDDVPGADKYILADALRGRDIQTDGGTKIGTVGDILVDAQNNVLGFSLSKVQVQGPIAEAKTIARAAVTDLGNGNAPMVVVLEQAEKLGIKI